ncbi:MAG: hypothetical protein U1E79_14960 [Ottowia sp.]
MRCATAEYRVYARQVQGSLDPQHRKRVEAHDGAKHRDGAPPLPAGARRPVQRHDRTPFGGRDRAR